MNSKVQLPLTVDPFQVSGTHLVLAGPLVGLVSHRYTEPHLDAYNVFPEHLRKWIPRHIAEITVSACCTDGHALNLVATAHRQILLEKDHALAFPRPSLRLYVTEAKDGLEARIPKDADPDEYPLFVDSEHPIGLPHHPNLLPILKDRELVSNLFGRKAIPYLVSDDMLAPYRRPSVLALQLQPSGVVVEGMMVYNTSDGQYACPGQHYGRSGHVMRRTFAHFLSTGNTPRTKELAPLLLNSLLELKSAALGGSVTLLLGYEGLSSYPAKPFIKLIGLERVKFDGTLDGVMANLTEQLQRC